MSETFRLKHTDADLISTLYSVNLFKTDISRKDIYSIQNTLRRYSKKYPHVSYLFVVSDTDSYCVRRKIKTRKCRGRYKTIVIGKKIERHIHLVLMGDENKSAYKCADDIKEALNRRFKGNVCQCPSAGKSTHAKKLINYCLRQANEIHKNGIFNQIIEKVDTLKINYF